MKKNQWGQTLLLGFIGTSLMTTSLSMVYVKYATRQMFSELSQLQMNRDALNNEWTQLLLEQSTLATDGRVDRIAHEKLNMHPPKSNEIVWVKQ
jgi:cell division protein FtsL